LLIRIKKTIKSTLAAIAYGTGLLQLLSARRLAGRAAVLMYHRVLPREQLAESFSAQSISVTPETFRRQMRLLRRLASPLSVAELAAALESGKFPRRACVVTFDDGWFDNLEHALPILAEYRIPAVIFLAVDYIGTGACFWQERLSRALYVAARAGEGSRPLFARFKREDILAMDPGRARFAVREIVDTLKHASVAERDAAIGIVLADLAARGLTVVSDHPDRFLDWDGVRKLAASGVVTIGSHCCTHTPLPKLALPEVEAELKRSRESIGRELGAVPATLAYPNGDYTPEIAALTGRNYSLAFTTERGLVTAGDDRSRLRRYNIHEHSTDTDGTFLARIAGLI
jgi:peptidoglycan/xylan/chitin deacetylase (PgdA/CDA1 family)